MPTLRQNRVITTDQTSGAVQRQAVKPSTIGLQSGRAAIRTQRAAPVTTEPGFRYTGKTVKAVRDWVNDAANAVQAFVTASKAVQAADALEGSEYEDPEVTKIVANFYAAALAMLQKCLASGQGVVDRVKDETSNNPSGVSEFHNRSAGTPEEDCPANGAMDAGSTVVMDHIGKVSATEPGTHQNPHVVDGLRIEASKRKAAAIIGALNPERVRQGLPDEILTDMNDPRLSWNQRAE